MDPNWFKFMNFQMIWLRIQNYFSIWNLEFSLKFFLKLPWPHTGSNLLSCLTIDPWKGKQCMHEEWVDFKTKVCKGCSETSMQIVVWQGVRCKRNLVGVWQVVNNQAFLKCLTFTKHKFNNYLLLDVQTLDVPYSFNYCVYPID